MSRVLGSVEDLTKKYGKLSGKELLGALHNVDPDLALLSSGGTESAVLLHAASVVDSRFLIFFVDTGELFPETLTYLEVLTGRLGLTNVRIIRATDDELLAGAGLWATDGKACCALRKTEPLRRELDRRQIRMYASGQRRAHGGRREEIQLFEDDGYGHILVNPIMNMTTDEVEAYFDKFELPIHPLVRRGYTSTGCLHCTEPNQDRRHPRAGRREPGRECGLNLSRAQREARA